MATIGPGNFIGQMALIDGGKRSATCRAVRDAVVIECTRDDFERLFQAANPFTFKLLDKIVEDLARRNRQANRRLSDLYSRPAETLRLLKEALLEIQAPDIDEEAEVRKMLAQQGGSITQQGIPTGGKAGRVEATKRVTTQAVKSFRPGADATEDDT
jgi:CRP-like cAMP-binding protein